MQFLVIVVVVSIALLALYILSRFVRIAGQALAFVCQVVSRIAIRISEALSVASGYCHQACLASLFYPSSDASVWGGLKVISRLVYFVLALFILAGESLNTLAALPALFHTPSNIHLPGVVEFASGALFIAAPGLLGAVLLECIGLIPSGAGLFPKIGTPARLALGIPSGLFLVLSVLLTGYFYLFRAAYLDDPASTQGMSLFILGGLGLVIAVVSVLALWALVIGGCGVVSALLWIVEQACRVLAAIASIIPSLADVLAVHLSQGTMSVHGEFEGHDPYKVPPLFLPASPSQESGVHLPGRASVVDADAAGDDEHDADGIGARSVENLLEEEMSNPEKNANLSFVGSVGSHVNTAVRSKIAAIGAGGAVLTSYSLDLASVREPYTIDGVTDLSPSYGLIKKALLGGDSESRVCAALLNDFAGRLVEAHLPLKAVPAPFLYFIDAPLLPCITDLLQEVKRRLPMVSQVVVTTISGNDAKRLEVQEGVAAMLKLHQEECIETVMVLDPRSSFASVYGEEIQLAFFAQTISSLLVARTHSRHNLSFPALLKKLHDSPLTAVSFASAAIAIGDVPKRWSWLPGLKGTVGSGSYSDLITQARDTIDRVLTDKDTCAFPVPVGSSSPCHVVLNVPLELRDPRFSACVSDMTLYVETSYPFAQLSVVRANGCAYSKHETGRYKVQASCLYPVSTAHLPSPASQRAKSVKITSLFTGVAAVEPVKVSGLMNAGEIEPGATAKPAKKTRPRGASARKNTRKGTQTK